MKINKEHSNNNKEVSIIYGDDNSININVFNNKILMEIAGSFDNNLKELEKISGSKIYFRGNTITIKGEKNANEKVRDSIEFKKTAKTKAIAESYYFTLALENMLLSAIH